MIEQELKTQLVDIQTILRSPEVTGDKTALESFYAELKDTSNAIQSMIDNSYKLVMPESYDLKIIVDGIKQETINITAKEYPFWDESKYIESLIKKVKQEAFSIYSQWEKRYRDQIVTVVVYSSDGDFIIDIGG